MLDNPQDQTPRRRIAGLHPESLMAQGLARETAANDAQMPTSLTGLVLLERLGQGGMGVVYRARQEELQRDVAVKLLTPEKCDDPLFLERLRREAILMARLRHPNIVTVYHMEQIGPEQTAIIMEYIDGTSLRAWMQQHPEGLNLADALAWAQEIASALIAAHSAGVIHRDLKPENILITRDKRAMVTDFGLALATGAEDIRLTASGTTVGTVDYMAPERFQEAQGDHRADIYALGVVFYEMLLGRVPRGHFPSPRLGRSDLPRELENTIMLALRENPAERFQSMSDFLQAMRSQESRGFHVSNRIIATALIALILALALPYYVKYSGASKSQPASTATTLKQSETPFMSQSAAENSWTDLIGGLLVAESALTGEWKHSGKAILSDASVAVLGVAKKMPPAYAVRARFTRLSGIHSIAIFFRIGSQFGSLDIDGWGTHVSGVQSLDGHDLRSLGGFYLPLENGKKYELVAEIRTTHIQIWLDGRFMSKIPISGKSLDLVSPWKQAIGNTLPDLAIGSYQSPTLFESLEWQPLKD